jgi:stress-induced morphogen
MPKGIIETKAQEKKWQRAKDIAEEQGKGQRWPLIMHIFKQMGGMSKDDSTDKNVAIERALAAQGKKTTIPEEAHQALHSWWQENKQKMLSPEQQKKLADIQQVKARRSKMGLVKKSQQIDDIYDALFSLKSVIEEEYLSKADEKRKSRMADWQLHPDHTPEEIAEMQKLTEQGYHPREASHIVSGGRGGRGEARDFLRALGSSVKPTMLSSSMMDHAKEFANDWLDNYHSKTSKYLQEEKNPVKHASAKMKEAHQERVGDYEKAYHDFLSSDDLKGKSPMQRHKAIKEWKSNWKQENPDHESKIEDVSKKGSSYSQAEQARKEHVEDIKRHLVSGPMATTDAPQEFEPTTARGVAEMMGTSGSEDAPPQYRVEKDPVTSFSTKHSKFVENVLKPSVSQVQEKQPEIKQETAPQPEPAKTIIRRKAKPEQLERMSRIDAAKMSTKGGE